MQCSDEKNQEIQLEGQEADDETKDNESAPLLSRAETQGGNGPSHLDRDASGADSFLGRLSSIGGDTSIGLLGGSTKRVLRRRHQQPHVDENRFAPRRNDGESRQAEDYFDRDSATSQLQRGIATGSRALCSLSRQTGETLVSGALVLGQHVSTQIQDHTKELSSRFERWRKEQVREQERNRQIIGAMSVLEDAEIGSRIQDRREFPYMSSQPPIIGLSGMSIFGRPNVGVSSDSRKKSEIESIEREVRIIEQQELEEAMRLSLEQVHNDQGFAISNRGVIVDSRNAKEAQEEDLSCEETEKQALEEAIRISLIDSELQMKS